MVNYGDKIDGSSLYEVVMINRIMMVEYMYWFKMGRRRKRIEASRGLER